MSPKRHAHTKMHIFARPGDHAKPTPLRATDRRSSPNRQATPRQNWERFLGHLPKPTPLRATDRRSNPKGQAAQKCQISFAPATTPKAHASSSHGSKIQPKETGRTSSPRRPRQQCPRPFEPRIEDPARGDGPCARSPQLQDEPSAVAEVTLDEEESAPETTPSSTHSSKSTPPGQHVRHTALYLAWFGTSS